MTLLAVEGLAVTYRTGSRPVRAVDGVSLAVARGETLAVVGESGCGKSTLARAVLRLIRPDAGRIVLDGTDITHAARSTLRPLRRRMQMVFQDPYGSLNPRRQAGRLIEEPMIVHGIGPAAERARRVAALMAQVGLQPDHADRLPHAFSGGQRQRIGIARALALDPELLVCDEPVSALDVSVRAQILNLLVALQRRRGLAMLFISHDLAVVRYVADRIMVMYRGRAVETGPAAALLAHPRHPYTEALLAAAPSLARIGAGFAGRGAVQGEPHDAAGDDAGGDDARGCAYRARCPIATARCAAEAPALRPVAGVDVACHLANQRGPG